MKKPFQTFLSIALYFLLSNSFLLGQKIDTPFFQKQLKLNGESDTKEITLPLRDSLEYVSFKITSIISSGELTVELYDPAGDKQGSFSIAGGRTPIVGEIRTPEGKTIRGKIYTSDASGNLLRTIKNPQRGRWKARVIINKAEGAINFQITKEVVVYKIE